MLHNANVYAVDTDSSKFESAKRNGVPQYQCFADVLDLEEESFDIVYDFVGLSATVNGAVRAAKIGSRVVGSLMGQVIDNANIYLQILSGIGEEMLNIPLISIVIKNIQLIGSLAGTKDDLATVLNLLADGLVKPEVQEMDFDDLHGAFKLLESGKPKGRLFVRPRQL